MLREAAVKLMEGAGGGLERMRWRRVTRSGHPCEADFTETGRNISGEDAHKKFKKFERERRLAKGGVPVCVAALIGRTLP